MPDDGPDLARFAALIEARRAELLALMESSENERSPVELDQSRVGRLSRMDAMQVQAMANAAESRRQRELQKLEAASRRIADESYGECLSCGEWIAEKRLLLDPAATLCIECASR